MERRREPERREQIFNVILAICLAIGYHTMKHRREPEESRERILVRLTQRLEV
jgi:hypothetical protein